MVKRDISSDLKEIVGQKLGDIPLVEEHEVLNKNLINSHRYVSYLL